MKERGSFKMKPWMWVLFLVGALLLIFNFDPAGDALEKIFGKGAKTWGVNIILIGMIIYFTFIARKTE